MACTREIDKAMREGQYQNPLAAYSTQQLREELSQRRRDHIWMRLKVKLKQKVKDVFEVIIFPIVIIIVWEIGKLIF
jgi:hypothetical protein